MPFPKETKSLQADRLVVYQSTYALALCLAPNLLDEAVESRPTLLAELLFQTKHTGLCKEGALTFTNKLVVTVACIAFLAGSMWPQGGATGAISGVVQDASEAVIAGAKVTVKNEATGEVVRQATTESSGLFTATLLPVGIYTLEVNAAGFPVTRFPGVVVRMIEDGYYVSTKAQGADRNHITRINLVFKTDPFAPESLDSLAKVRRRVIELTKPGQVLAGASAVGVAGASAALDDLRTETTSDQRRKADSQPGARPRKSGCDESSGDRK